MNPDTSVAAPPQRPAGNWFAALKSKAPRALRWFSPEDCHLTLCFFGPYRAERFPATKELVAKMPPPDFVSSCRHLRLLPHGRNFSAVSLELEDPDAKIARYMSEWGPRLAAAAGVAPDTRPPLPHVTLARPDRRASAGQRREIAEWSRKVQVSDLRLELREVAIYGWAEDRSVRQFCILE